MSDAPVGADVGASDATSAQLTAALNAQKRLYREVLAERKRVSGMRAALAELRRAVDVPGLPVGVVIAVRKLERAARQ